MNPRVYVANEYLVDERLSGSEIAHIVNHYARRHPSIRHYQAIYIDFVLDAVAGNGSVDPISPHVVIGATLNGVPLSGNKLAAVLEHRLNVLATAALRRTKKSHPRRPLPTGRPLRV